jgi:hypothetical protein
MLQNKLECFMSVTSFWVSLKTQQPALVEHLKVSNSSEAGLLNKRLCLAAALGVNKFIK